MMKIDFDDKMLMTFFGRALKKNMEIVEYLDDLWGQLADRIMEEEGFEITLAEKVALSKHVMEKALDEYGVGNTCLAWTGGKDSTLVLWLVREVVKKRKWKMPKVMFIDEGHVFEEIVEFVRKMTKKWKLDVDVVHNNNVSSKAKKVGDVIKVAELDKRNREEVKRVGYKKKTFAFEPESLVGNHLMKTVAMNRYLEKSNYQAVITGIRWDEQGARQEETYNSPRGDEFTPKHVRIHPILHITERDVWDITRLNKVPYCKLYEDGFRSLGAKGTTTKADDKPAWEQDFDKVSERAGRQQDKEEVMKRLRDLGYM